MSVGMFGRATITVVIVAVALRVTDVEIPMVLEIVPVVLRDAEDVTC